MKLNVIWGLIIALLLMLGGIGKTLSQEGSFQGAVNEKEKDIDIFLDGTESMKGFVSAPNNAYSRTIIQVENTLISRFSEYERRYYKFGNICVKIDREGFLSSISGVGFYNDPNIKMNTRLDSVFARIKPLNLTLIVTDLFQQDSDIAGVVQKIKERGIPSNMSIGFIGVLSEFKGMVYDVSPKGLQYPFQGKRPFYIIAVGEYDDLCKLFDCIKSDNSLSDEKLEFLIISSRFTKEPISFYDSNIKELAGLIQLSWWNKREVKPDTVIFRFRNPSP